MPDHERALAAICDTFLPGDATLPAASALGVHRLLRSEVEALGRPSLIGELDQLLDTIESPLLNLALTGKAVRFSALDQAARERYLKRWAASPIPLKRKAFQVVKRLTLLYAYGMDGSPYGANTGYARPPLDEPAAPSVHVRAPRANEVIEADVCVIGSGAGGGVVAAELARSGKRVVVLERATPRTERDFDGRELAGYASLFVERGIASTVDRSIALLAGSALGGGTVVNWNTSLRIPAPVEADWRSVGVDDLGPHYDAIEERIDVDTDESSRNGPNAALERGARALNVRTATISRNVKGCGDCGHCTFGCRRGAKQSTLRTFLADAQADGAEIIAPADVRRIEVSDGRVSGVVARVTGGELRVRAPIIAVAAGAIYTPALLLRSGIATAEAGRHFHLHPVVLTAGAYDEDLRGTWTGVPQSVLVEEFADRGDGYGFRVETPAGYPGLTAAALPWWGPRLHTELMREARHLAPFIGIVRDRTEGRVTADRDGEPLVSYVPGSIERELLTRAMVECARMHVASGARRIVTLHTPPIDGARDDIDRLIREIERRGVVSNSVGVFSAHQMSSARIGSDRASSVADPDGQAWDVRGLYLTDASAFPTAVGVNPMLTVMALARRTAQRMRAAT